MANKYLHPTRFLMHRYFYLAIIVLFITFFALPYGCLSFQIAQPADGDTSAEALSLLRDVKLSVNNDAFFRNFEAEPLSFIYAGLGFLCAAVLFRHLFSCRQSMLVAALPDSRFRDFGRRTVCYLVFGLLPAALSLAAQVGALAVNGLLAYVNWQQVLGRFAALLLLNVYGYAAGALACAATGTVWSALLVGGMLVCGMEATYYLWQQLAYRYLKTMLNTNDWLKTYSPVITLYKGLVQPEAFRWVPGAAAIGVLLGLALWLYRVRPVEAAGRVLAFSALHWVVGAALALAGGTLVGTLCLYNFSDSEWALLLGLAMGALTIWWVSQAVFAMQLRGSGRHWYVGAACAAVLLAGAAALHFDWIGYDRYLPRREQLTAITYVQTDGGIAVTLQDEQSLDAAYAWASLMRDEAAAMPDGLMPESRWTSESRLTLTYQLDGKTVRRCYPNDAIRTQAQPYIKAVMESDDYRLSLMKGMHMDRLDEVESVSLYSQRIAYGLDRVEYFRRFGLLQYHTVAAQDGRQMQVWMEALRADLCSRTLEDVQRTPILGLTVQGHHRETGEAFYQTLDIYETDRHLLSAAAGDKAREWCDYLTGGFVDTDQAVVVKQTYDQTIAQMQDQSYITAQPVSAQTAEPQQAAQWVRQALERDTAGRYYMPNIEQSCQTLLFVYDRQNLELQDETGRLRLEDTATLPQRQLEGFYPDSVYYLP